MKYLGFANGWDETPACVKESREKGHKVVAETTGRCETTYICEEGDECAVILHNGNMEVGKFQIMKSYTGKARVGFSGNSWWIGIDAVKYYMVMTRPEEV